LRVLDAVFRDPRIVELKRRLGRPKDQIVLAILEAVLDERRRGVGS
jgi:hypothetical protein